MSRPLVGKAPGSAANNGAAIQRAAILDHLRHVGPLSTLEARRQLDVLAPAARIKELRDFGHEIATTWAMEPTDSGRLHRVARYVLVTAQG